MLKIKLDNEEFSAENLSERAQGLLDRVRGHPNERSSIVGFVACTYNRLHYLTRTRPVATARRVVARTMLTTA